MTISDRIKAITEMVMAEGKCGVIADIGCDHCLTLMRLLELGAIEKGIGSDIKDGPLLKARQNIERLGYSDRIELRKGYGLSKIRPNEADTIIITGMGGHLLTDILREGADVAKTARQLILQPQNDVRTVREFLHENGYKISDEKMATDDGKFYTIIKAENGSQKYQSETDYIYGKVLIEKKDPVFVRYIKMRIEKNERIIVSLKEQASISCAYKIAELNEENRIMGEVLLCLSE